MRPIETAEIAYYPVPGLAVAERALAMHWERRDVAPFRPQGVSAKVSAIAEVNHGRWIVKCPFCTSAQFAAKGDHRFFCVSCLNESVGRQWVRVLWPGNPAAIEAALLARPERDFMHWTAGQKVATLLLENAAGFHHSWTAPRTWAVGEVVTAAIMNTHVRDQLLEIAKGAICQGRLTLTTGTPVTTADVLAAATLYFTPHRGNQIEVYDGSANWKLYTFAEISLNISGLNADTNYDVYVYDNAGTLTLSATAWTNDTTRATALALQNGVYVKTGATGYRYLGTIRMTSVAGECEDSTKFRGVWNCYQRAVKHLSAVDTTNSWQYTTATWRSANNDTTLGVNRVAAVIGLSEDAVWAHASALALNAAAFVAVGVGIDATNTNSAQLIGGKAEVYYQQLQAEYEGFLAAGYHYLQRLEISEAANTTIWYGDNNYAYVQTGMVAKVWC